MRGGAGAGRTGKPGPRVTWVLSGGAGARRAWTPEARGIGEGRGGGAPGAVVGGYDGVGDRPAVYGPTGSALAVRRTEDASVLNCTASGRTLPVHVHAA